MVSDQEDITENPPCCCPGGAVKDQILLPIHLVQFGPQTVPFRCHKSRKGWICKLFANLSRAQKNMSRPRTSQIVTKMEVDNVDSGAMHL